MISFSFFSWIFFLFVFCIGPDLKYLLFCNCGYINTENIMVATMARKNMLRGRKHHGNQVRERAAFFSCILLPWVLLNGKLNLEEDKSDQSLAVQSIGTSGAAHLGCLLHSVQGWSSHGVVHSSSARKGQITIGRHFSSSRGRQDCADKLGKQCCKKINFYVVHLFVWS